MVQFLYRIQPVRPESLIEGPTENEEQIVLHDDTGIKNRVFRGELFPFRIALPKAEKAP